MSNKKNEKGPFQRSADGHFSVLVTQKQLLLINTKLRFGENTRNLFKKAYTSLKRIYSQI